VFEFLRRKIMQKKLWAILFTFVVSMLFAVPALAYYSSISGELRDSKTGALWTQGANVEVYNCNTLATIDTAVVDSSGVFSISLPVTYTSAVPICVEVIFNDGGNGAPGNAAKGPYPDRSTSLGGLNTGVYFTGTGPTAIVLKEASAQSSGSTMWAPVVLLGAALVAGSFWTWRRRAVRS
jgi:hypothetical protein